jgi:translocator protein
MGRGQVGIKQVRHRGAGVQSQRGEEGSSGVHAGFRVAQDDFSSVTRVGLPGDVSGGHHTVHQVSNRRAGQPHLLAELTRCDRSTCGFGDHDMQQGAKVSGSHVVRDGKNSADLLRFGRQYPQIGHDLRLQRGSLVGGLIRAHDTLQLIRNRRLLQLINTSIIETLGEASKGENMNKATLAATALAVSAAAGIGSVASRASVDSWYSRLRKPRYVPPNAVFPVAWTSLYTDIAATSAVAIDRLRALGRHEEARDYTVALGVNLVLNAGWSWLFFKYHKLGASTVGAAVLAASSADLARRAARADPRAGAALLPYPLWTAFATAMSSHIWVLNRS